MARTHARIQSEIWNDRDWRALSRDAQWAYMLLLSQPQMNNCGVLPLVPRRWSGLAAETTSEDIFAVIDELEQARFVASDRDTEELLIRTFIRHDRIERQPNLVTSAKRQFAEVQSSALREALRAENPHLFAESELLREPLVEPLSEDLPEGVNARVPSPSHNPAPTPREGDAPPGSTNGLVGEELSLISEQARNGHRDDDITDEELGRMSAEANA